MVRGTFRSEVAPLVLEPEVGMVMEASLYFHGGAGVRRFCPRQALSKDVVYRYRLGGVRYCGTTGTISGFGGRSTGHK